MSSRVVVEEATRIPPSSASVLTGFRRPPSPRPVVLNRRTAVGRKIAYQLHVGIFVQVGIDMKLPGDEVVQFLAIGSVCESETGNRVVCRWRYCRNAGGSASRGRYGGGLRLSCHKGEVEV